MSNHKFPAFNKFACVGDRVSIDLGGVTFVARLEHDTDSRPEDSECYDAEQIAAWKRDEWSYVGVVISVQLGDVELIDHAASLWGIECNFPGSDNAHLTDCANDLLVDAIDAARNKINILKACLDAVAIP